MEQLIPKRICSGYLQEGHVQGIAIDIANGHVYFSFTTLLLKTDLLGRPLGSVKNFIGHLGCITMDAKRGRVYGSLELKHDAIGVGITQRTGKTLGCEDAFYLVSFDCARIDRMEMDAETDGVMQAVYLQDVATDYLQTDEISGHPHRYGCSGIDGIALGPCFGGGEEKIMVAYGIYRDVERQDNDHQVILQLDPSAVEQYGHPLSQIAPHHSGPTCAEKRYFFRTGNTTYGIQNLEYDPHTKLWLLAVYPGKKNAYSNFPMYAIDGAIAPVLAPLAGRDGQRGLLLTSARLGEPDTSIPHLFGCRFPYGQTGMASLGNGMFCFSVPSSIPEEGRFASTLVIYRFTPNEPQLFTEA